MNNKGFSLIEMIIVMGIGTVFMLAFTTVIVNQQKAINTANANSDMVSYINTIRTNLNTGVLATAALEGTRVDGEITIKDPINTVNVLSSAGYKQQPNDVWSVESVTYAAVYSVPAQAGLYRLTLQVILAKDSKRTIGYSKARKIIGDVYCILDGNNVIVNCLGTIDTATLAKQMCGSLSGTWDITSGTCTIASGTGTGLDNGGHNGEIK